MTEQLASPLTNVESHLVLDVAAAAVTLKIGQVFNGAFPAVGNFRVAVSDDTRQEIMVVTSVSGRFFTVLRGQEGTVAVKHVTGARVRFVLTPAAIAQSAADQVVAQSGLDTGEIQHITVSVPLATIQSKTSGVPFNIGASLPTNAQLLHAHINVVAPITGGTVSACAATVQNTGEPAGAVLASTDVFTATGLIQKVGSNPYVTRGGQQLQLTLTATGDTLAHATAGQVKVELFYAIVP